MSENDEKLAAWFKERDAAFEAGDIEWAAKQMPWASSRRVVELAFHKAREICMSISDEKRRESRAILAAMGSGPLGFSIDMPEARK